MGSFCSSQTTNNNSTVAQPNPQVLGDYLQMIGQAQGVGANLGNLPAQPVAQYSPEQYAGIAGINAAAGTAQPYFNAGFGTMNSGLNTVGQSLGYLPYASGAIGGGLGTLGGALPYYNAGAGMVGQSTVNPLTSGAVQQYMSQYLPQVVGATEQQFDNQNAIQQNNLTGSAIMGGNAFGGDRAGVAQAVLAGQQQTAEAPVIANLENSGWSQALQQGNVQQQLAQSAAGLYGNLGAGVAGVGTGMGALGSMYGNLANIGGGLGATQAGIGTQEAALGPAATNTQLGVAGAQLQGGASEQAQQQAMLNAAYQQYLNSIGVTGLQFEAPIVEGTGSLTGGTSTTYGQNQAQPSIFSMLSDKRAKENIKKVGELFDGQSVYRFNYKGDPTTRIGLIAQNVERHHPDAIKEIGGLKSVDYDAATRDAARKRHFARGGLAYDDGGAAGAQSGGLGGIVGFDALSKIFGAEAASNQLAANLEEGVGFAAGGLALGQNGMGVLGGNIFSGAPGFAGIPLMTPVLGSGVPKPPAMSSAPTPTASPASSQSGGLLGQVNSLVNPQKPSAGAGQTAPQSNDFMGMFKSAYQTINGLMNGQGASAAGGGGPLDITPDLSLSIPSDATASIAPAAMAGDDAMGLGMLALASFGGRIEQHGRQGYAEGGSPIIDQAFDAVNGAPDWMATANVPAPPDQTTSDVPLPRARPTLADLAPASSPAPGPSGSSLPGLVALQHAVYGQESGYGANSRTSSAGAHGPMQIEPDTFASFARSDERIDDSDDNKAVGNRILANYYQRYGGDPARAAVAYYSGPGNVAPPDSPTPWIKNITTDRNGNPVKPVSSYVGDVIGRMYGLSPSQTAAPTGAGSSSLQDLTRQYLATQPKGADMPKPDMGMALLAGLAGAFSGHGIISGGIGGALQNYQQQQAENRADVTTQQGALRLAQEAAHQQKQIEMETQKLSIAQQQLQSQEGMRKFQESQPKVYNDPLLGPRSILPSKTSPSGWVFGDTGEAVGAPPTAAPNQNGNPERPFQGAPASTATMIKAQQMGLHGQAFLDALPPQIASTVAAVGNYDAPITLFSKMGRSGISQDRALNLIRQFNPDYDNYWASAHGQSIKEFLAGGPNSPAAQIRSYNTAIGHAGDAWDALQEMKRINPGILQAAQNAGVPFLSYAAAQLQNKAIAGTPMGVALNKYVTASTLYGAEVSKLYTGSAGSQEERNTVRAPLDQNKSLPEIEAGLRTSVHMMGSRANALEDQYRTAQNAPGLAQYGTKGEIKDFPVLHDRAQDALKKIGATGTAAIPQLSGADRQALDWANAHPKDPRATTIKSKLGVQ